MIGRKTFLEKEKMLVTFPPPPPPPPMYSIGYVFRVVNPLPDDKILDWSKLKQFADDNSKFDENSRKFSKLVENTVGKGEIAQKGP